jgi:hypothetical protein
MAVKLEEFKAMRAKFGVKKADELPDDKLQDLWKEVQTL